MLWDSWMKSTKSVLFCFHGGPLLRRKRWLILVATAMESSIPIYFWVSECVFFRYPGKSFLHDELSSLRFEGFEDVSGSGCTAVCVDTLLNTCQVSASDWAGYFAESSWKENWSQRSVWTLGMMAERNRQIFMEYCPTGHRKKFANIEEMSGKREVTWSSSSKSICEKLCSPDGWNYFHIHCTCSLVLAISSAVILLIYGSYSPLSAWACFPFT